MFRNTWLKDILGNQAGEGAYDGRLLFCGRDIFQCAIAGPDHVEDWIFNRFWTDSDLEVLNEMKRLPKLENYDLMDKSAW